MMAEKGKSVELKIDVAMLQAMEEEQIKVLKTVEYDKPVLENDFGHRFVSTLEIKVDRNKPIKANLVHNNTDQSFYDGFRQQLVAKWRDFALNSKDGAVMGYSTRDFRDISKKLGQCSGKMYEFLYDKIKRCAIFEYIKNQKLKTPVQLEIDMLKWVKDPYRQGNDRRYLRTYIEGRDVTGMVANATGHKISKNRDAYGALIINGTGMDMFLAVQQELHSYAERFGYHNMIDLDNYKNKYYEKKMNKHFRKANPSRQDDMER